LYHPPFYWGRLKISEYLDEAKLIQETLGVASTGLKERLGMKMELYKEFLNDTNRPD
jgi:hypothetical protein